MWQALLKNVLMSKLGGNKGGGGQGMLSQVIENKMGQRQEHQPYQQQFSPTQQPQQSQWAPFSQQYQGPYQQQVPYQSSWAPLNYWGNYGRRY